jgi:hypothetical protein
VISKSSRIEACDAVISGPISRTRPDRSSATVSSTRWFSVTTCRARRSITGSETRERSATEASRNAGTPSASAAASHARRRSAYSPPAWRCGALVSTTSTASPSAARSNGMCSTSSERQSRNSACPSRHRIDADWSMIPVGTPA